jgi:hypothetical protein
MHTIKRTCQLAILAMSVIAAPVFAQNVEITASTELGQAKYAQRVKDLGDQIRLVRSKGLITQDDEAKFTTRQQELKSMEEKTREGGFQKPEADQLEKSITKLNADLFAASHKSDPVKPGQAEKEVHDPNLIPAYPDANLQPGSGSAQSK